ncbi:unnamed protein product [Brugia timori]|uniref:Uncharacterized protein n=1 Tax=Brugia timori TaxID=42155 RepID=A0A3P7UHY4_9BILA|nr:unnamed protein product [Brugia timori]
MLDVLLGCFLYSFSIQQILTPKLRYRIEQMKTMDKQFGEGKYFHVTNMNMFT